MRAKRKTNAARMPIVRPQTHGWRLCQRTGGVVASLAQFFVYHINAITVILNHFKIVDDGLHVLFFFHLLVDEPLNLTDRKSVV